jgi:uncharacterized membrane protein
MQKSFYKSIAPFVVSIFIVGYYAAIGLVLFKSDIPAIMKIAVVVISIAISAVMVAVFIERIKEIRSGEEDDIGKY